MHIDHIWGNKVFNTSEIQLTNSSRHLRIPLFLDTLKTHTEIELTSKETDEYLG